MNQALRDARRELAKWLNEEQTKPIDRAALATVLVDIAAPGQFASNYCPNCGAQCECETTKAQPADALTDDELFSALKSVDPETKRLPPGLRDFARVVLATQKGKQITHRVG